MAVEQEEVVGRWWNGVWGRLARRDVWLMRRPAWVVELRKGDADSGKSVRREFHDEGEARAFVAKALERGAKEWKELPPSEGWAGTKPPT